MKMRHTIDSINERIHERGLICISYAGSTMRKSNFKCSHGHLWSVRADAVLSGNGCPHCAGRAKLKLEEINKRLSTRSILCIRYSGSVMGKSRFRCVNGHEWETTADSVMRSSGCPHCSKRVRLSVEDINERIAARGLSCLIYRGSSRKLSRFRCGNGHEWDATSDNVCNKGTGCPYCCEYGGFNPSLPGYIYFLRSDDSKFVKVGITNRPTRRFSQLKRATPFGFKLMRMMMVDDARNLERKYHSSFVNAGLSGFDGCTEWLKWDNRILEMLEATRED